MLQMSQANENTTINDEDEDDDCILQEIKNESSCDESVLHIPRTPKCPDGNEPNDEDSGPSVLPEAGLSADYASDENAIYVSAETYDIEKANFDALVEKTLTAEKQHKMLESQGEDSNELLKAEQEVVKLNERLKLMSQYVDSLRIENKEPTINAGPATQWDINEKPSWAHLYAGVNQHRHKVFGTVAEFYQHKTNIISGLKILYQPDGPPPSATESADQPKALLVSLLKHQETGLKWLLWRETQKIRGGILGDDMGLGKTLSMIALILASNENKQRLNPVAKNNYDYKRSWEHQLQLYRQQQSRGKRIRLFDDSDSEEEYEVLPHKREYVPPEEVDEDFLLSSQERSSNSAGTLIICPMSVMSQWAAEADNKVNRKALNVHIYHGIDRRRAIELSKFRRMDMVITSYSTAVAEWNRFGSNSWLFSLEWERLILDEAHIIRNTKTACSQVVSSIKAQCRWALTGTPIQNRALDCFALLNFLNVPNFNDLQQWRRYLNEGMASHRRLSFLIKPLMLRRTKLQLQESGEMPPLPPLQEKLIDVHLSPPEMAVYQILSAISVKIFAQFLRQRDQNNKDLNYYSNETTPNFMADDLDNKYHEMYQNFLRSIGYNPRVRVKGIVILVLLLRLRQFCCHPGLTVKMLNGDMEEPESDEEDRLEIERLEDLNIKRLENDEKESMQRNLNHIEKVTNQSPIDMETAMKLLRPSNPIFEFSSTSAKAKLVFATLEQLLQETSDKIIVVSQWTSFLFVIKQHLECIGHETLDFNGKLNVMQRSKTLSEFNSSNNNKRILLLSLTAGGVGLNLNVANHLLLVDLHWNPQLERQAQDRIYRYGQTKPAYIYRFMCKDTVEQRIKALQDYKREISNVVLDPDSVLSTSGCNGLSLKDLKKIFGMN